MANDVSSIAAVDLQNLLNEETKKRVDAENMAQALVEEFTSCNDFDDVRNKFREKLKEFAPAALINIINLATNAESESVRASLNKWMIEWVMSDKIDGSAGELGSLLKQLQKAPAQAPVPVVVSNGPAASNDVPVATNLPSDVPAYYRTEAP